MCCSDSSSKELFPVLKLNLLPPHAGVCGQVEHRPISYHFYIILYLKLSGSPLQVFLAKWNEVQVAVKLLVQASPVVGSVSCLWLALCSCCRLQLP